MAKNKLSSTQVWALTRLSYTEWKSAYVLQVRRSTLEALVKKGRAERKVIRGAGFFPDNCILFRGVTSND